MTIKIAHISDVHFRSLKRHEEYKIVFKKLFDSLKENSVDLIFIGGDIVHSYFIRADNLNNKYFNSNNISSFPSYSKD